MVASRPVTPRQFPVPKALCSSSFGPMTTLDEMEFVSTHRTPAGKWAAQVLARENAKTLDVLLGDDTKLPRGVLASAADVGDMEVVVALVNHKGELWRGHGWSKPTEPIVADATLDLEAADGAFVARALRDGSDGVLMRAYMPMAFLSPAITAASETPDLPAEGARIVAIVDSVDKNAVLEVLAIAPGPKIFRRNDGQWHEDANWVEVLRSVTPPSMARLEGVQASSVITQVDEATAGVDFEPFEIDQRERYVPIRAGSYVEELAREADDRIIALTVGLIAVAGKELSPRDYANTERLRRYWLYGKGAAKIRWFTPGAWRRCYRNLVKYLGPKMTPGYCTNLSQRLGGPGVATHVGSRKRGR
jgi:hypothetical protein